MVSLQLTARSSGTAEGTSAITVMLEPRVPSSVQVHPFLFSRLAQCTSESDDPQVGLSHAAVMRLFTPKLLPSLAVGRAAELDSNRGLHSYSLVVELLLPGHRKVSHSSHTVRYAPRGD